MGVHIYLFEIIILFPLDVYPEVGLLDHQIRSDQSLSRVQLFATPWIAARQASLSITNSRSSPRLTSIESVMPSSHLILCRPLLLLPPVPPSIRVFSNESTLRMRWPKYCSFSFSIIPSKEISYINTYMSNLEKWYRWSYLQSRNRDTSIQYKCVDTKGEGGLDKLGDWDWHIHNTIFKTGN